MEFASSPPSATQRRTSWPAAAVPLALLVALVLAVPPAYRLRHEGRIMPGVRIAGVAVGGLSPAAATERLHARGLHPDVTVTLTLGDELHPRAAASLGLVYDEEATLGQAYEVGRKGAMPRAFLEAVRARALGVSVAPRIRYSPSQAERAVAELAAQYDRLPIDASLMVAGNEVLSRPATPGRRLDRRAAIEALARVAASGRWPPVALALPVESVAPVVGDVGRAARQAQLLLAAPIVLQAGDRTWTMTPGELAPMLVTSIESGTVALELDRSRLEVWLSPVTEAVQQVARNPRFHFDLENRQLLLLEGGRPGYRLDVDATAGRILAAAEDPKRTVRVATVRSEPAVADNATAAELGIRELIHEETSRFVGSPKERIHNIGIAAARFHGLLVAPDEVFSFNEHLGDVTADAGYQKTKIIMDGATRDGLGGGICQVSTTLFRAAFWAGLPIVERVAHGYRVPYYEQGAPVGLDATVFLPSPDLKIRNDTGRWILIETSSDPRRATVTFRLLGTRVERTVELLGPVVSNVVPPPPPQVVIDPKLPPGARSDIELARSGATVVLTRTISLPNGEKASEVFRSHYRPTGAITAVGPPLAGEEMAATQTAASVEGIP